MIEKKKTIIIAEAGVNHNGDLNLAFQLIDVAAKAGVDYVKFQTFKAEKLVSTKAKQAAYQTRNTGKEESQYEMLKRLELSPSDHYRLIDYCNVKEIRFLSSAFDIESIDELKKMGINLWKVPSGEITNLPYLQKIGSFNETVVLSTGMSTLHEVEMAIHALVNAGTEKSKITVLHCNTEYPTPMSDVNLNVMHTMQSHLGVSVGYSDHTLGIEVPIAAVAMGASIIEKHFTLDKNMDGPDHRASLEPGDLKKMVESIRNIEKALGSGIKEPSQSELKNIDIARKSIHLAKNIKKGTAIDATYLEMKRPGNGISPMEFENVIGKVVTKDLRKDDQLKWEDLQ
ncbi:MAG: N-acetylneuraminate synthase [Marinilabiliaceae bacterium]|nr:N-acetylneuraminate synthase [Marinilabiliaceae bacterium]